MGGMSASTTAGSNNRPPSPSCQASSRHHKPRRDEARLERQCHSPTLIGPTADTPLLPQRHRHPLSLTTTPRSEDKVPPPASFLRAAGSQPPGQITAPPLPGALDEFGYATCTSRAGSPLRPSRFSRECRRGCRACSKCLCSSSHFLSPSMLQALVGGRGTGRVMCWSLLLGMLVGILVLCPGRSAG